MEVLPKIIPELINLIPESSREERSLLSRSLSEKGQLDDILTGKLKDVDEWFIIDGHTRHEALLDLGMDPRFANPIEFDTMDDVKIWMIKHQMGRRNLQPFTRSELAMKLEHLIEKKPNNQYTKSASGKYFTEADAPSRKIAELAGVSHVTYARAKVIKEKATEEVKQKLREGDESIHSVYTKLKGTHVSKNSGDNEWYTPSRIVEAARIVLGNIDLDPASCDKANDVIKANTYYTEENDGLTKDWKGKVWLNPPYAQPLIKYFTDKLISSYLSKEVPEAVLIVNNGTETKWAQACFNACSSVCFFRGRQKYVTYTAPLQGQMLFYFGGNKEKFKGVFNELGEVLQR